MADANQSSYTRVASIPIMVLKSQSTKTQNSNKPNIKLSKAKDDAEGT